MDWGVVIMWAAISWLCFEVVREIGPGLVFRSRVRVDLHCWGLAFMVRPISGQATLLVGPILIMVN